MIQNLNNNSYFTKNDKIGSFENAVTKGYNAGIYGDIYITGFGYIIWTKLPEFMKNVPEIGDFVHLTRTLYKAVQIPDWTLNTTEVVTGFAGTNKISVPTTLDLDTNLSITYNEISSTPITRFHQRWISAMRDPASGVADITDYGLEQYSGELLYITTKPVHYGSGSSGATNSRIIETAHLFTHVFPTTDKQSNFSMNIESSDKIEVEVNYKFSQMFVGEAVNEFAANKLGDIMKLKDMDQYEISDDGTVDSSY